MQDTLRRIIQAVLGEQELSIRPLFINLDGTSGFIPMETRRRGYRYHRNDQEITLTRVDPLTTIAGMPPLYYFKGHLTSGADRPILHGRILMSTMSKYFVLGWVGIVVVAFLGTLLWATMLAGQFMISSSPAIREHLATAGFLIGVVLGLGLFGALIIAVIRGVSQAQKRKLIWFITRAQDSGLTTADKRL